MFRPSSSDQFLVAFPNITLLTESSGKGRVSVKEGMKGCQYHVEAALSLPCGTNMIDLGPLMKSVTAFATGNNELA